MNFYFMSDFFTMSIVCLILIRQHILLCFISVEFLVLSLLISIHIYCMCYDISLYLYIIIITFYVWNGVLSPSVLVYMIRCYCNNYLTSNQI